MNTATYSLDLGWLDRLRVRLALWRDRRRAGRALNGRVGLLDSGELVIVTAGGSALVISRDTTRSIDDMLWGHAISTARGAAVSRDRPSAEHCFRSAVPDADDDADADGDARAESRLN